MSNYNLYVVGRKSYLHNSIKVLGVFPNEHLANKFSSVIGQLTDIFCIPSTSLKIGAYGLEIPFSSVKIK